MVLRDIRMLIKAFRLTLKKFHETPSLKTEIPRWYLPTTQCHIHHTSNPRFWTCQKWVKLAHFFINWHEIFIEKEPVFFVKNSIFSKYKWAIANCFWEWNNLSNVINSKNKVWYFCFSKKKKSTFFEIFW